MRSILSLAILLSACTHSALEVGTAAPAPSASPAPPNTSTRFDPLIPHRNYEPWWGGAQNRGSFELYATDALPMSFTLGTSPTRHITIDDVVVEPHFRAGFSVTVSLRNTDRNDSGKIRLWLTDDPTLPYFQPQNGCVIDTPAYCNYYQCAGTCGGLCPVDDYLEHFACKESGYVFDEFTEGLEYYNWRLKLARLDYDYASNRWQSMTIAESFFHEEWQEPTPEE